MANNLYTTFKRSLDDLSEPSLRALVNAKGAFLSVHHLLVYAMTHYNYTASLDYLDHAEHTLDTILHTMHQAFDDPRAYQQVVNAFDRHLTEAVNTLCQGNPAQLARLRQHMDRARQYKRHDLFDCLCLDQSYPRYPDTLSQRIMIELSRHNPQYRHIVLRYPPPAGLQTMIAARGADNLSFSDFLHYVSANPASAKDYHYISTSIIPRSLDACAARFLALSLLGAQAHQAPDPSPALNRLLARQLNYTRQLLYPEDQRAVSALDLTALTERLLTARPAAPPVVPSVVASGVMARPTPRLGPSRSPDHRSR
jgi:hypothetical protein